MPPPPEISLRTRLRSALHSRFGSGIASLRPDAATLLWLMAILAAAPLLALSVHDVLSRIPTAREPDLVRATEGRLALANAAGAVQAQVRDASAMLRGLAGLGSEAGPSREKCASLLGADGWPGGIALFGADGGLLCGSLAGDGPMPPNAAGQEFLRAALLARGQTPVLAGLSEGWVTGRPATVMALALPGTQPGDPPSAVLAVGLDLDWLHRANTAASPALLLLRPHDMLLLAAPDRGHATLGRRLLWPGVLRQLRLGDRQGVTVLNSVADPAAMSSGLVIWTLLAAPSLPPMVLAALWQPGNDAAAAMPGPFALLWQAELMLAIGLAAAWLLVGRRFSAGLAVLAQGSDKDGKLVGKLGRAAPRTLRAIASRLATHAAREAEWSARLSATQAELRLLADSASEVFEVLDAGFRRRAVYGACRALLGYTPEEWLSRDPQADRLPEDWQRLRAALAELAGETGSAACESRVRRRDGGLIWLESRLSPLPGGGVIVVSRDASSWREGEQALAEANLRLATLALEDALTGLANRRRFDAAVVQEMRRAARGGVPLALVLIRLDGLAVFRERQGAAVGDATLRAVARAVAGALLRPGDVAARLEGDRLALLLPGTNRIGAELVARRVLAAIEAILTTDPQASDGQIVPRAGIAITGGETASPAALLDAAERALVLQDRASLPPA